MSVYQRSPRNINIWYCLMVDGQVTLRIVIVHIRQTGRFLEFLLLCYVIVLMALPTSEMPEELSSLGVPLGTIRIFLPLKLELMSFSGSRLLHSAATLLFTIGSHLFS